MVGESAYKPFAAGDDAMTDAASSTGGFANARELPLAARAHGAAS